ncbi:DUF481 domain-containing protein [Vibrio genomosp. F10]|uniref:DUF481 domain-containing protein n=1 Tax=Vibrio genomosp. F10 TaxID=723171 RepID=UPI0003692F9E|nr:hypothetical protein A1QK_03485 [Vibrio genomosp. F10 str. 9ZD137]
MRKLWFACFCTLTTSLAYAKEATPSPTQIELPSPWKSEIEFGYQAHSGNSDSQSLNSRMNAEYTSGRHRSSGEWKFHMLYKDGEEDKRQSTYTAQSDYKLSPKTYLYGSFKGIETRYSAYFKDHTLSAGLGYQFTNTEQLTIELELGPGYRYQEPNLDEIKDDDIIFPETVQEAIFRGNINVDWNVIDNLTLSADITTVTGLSNTRLDTDFSMTNNITDDIALKLAYSQQYHDKVPEGLSNSDSIFSVNLLFVF